MERLTPLVTVVTPTWRRPNLLVSRCIPSVWAQTWRPLEHLVVSDGPDPGLRHRLSALGYTHGPTERRLVECGRNWGGVGAAPRGVGAWLAAGEWVAYLDDDNTYLPGHIEAMVSEAERSGADLVCTAWSTPDGGVSGWTPPGVNRTDTSSFMHRANLLRMASWSPGDGYAADGALVERWLAAGATWSFLPSPTMVYHGARSGAPE